MKNRVFVVLINLSVLNLAIKTRLVYKCKELVLYNVVIILVILYFAILLMEEHKECSSNKDEIKINTI